MAPHVTQACLVSLSSIHVQRGLRLAILSTRPIMYTPNTVRKLLHQCCIGAASHIMSEAVLLCNYRAF